MGLMVDSVGKAFVYQADQMFRRQDSTRFCATPAVRAIDEGARRMAPSGW
jgi:hypothetical protein